MSTPPKLMHAMISQVKHVVLVRASFAFTCESELCSVVLCLLLLLFAATTTDKSLPPTFDLTYIRLS